MAETTPVAKLDDETEAALTLFNSYVDADRARTRHEKQVKKAERAKEAAAVAVRNAKGAEATAEAEAAYREAQEAYKQIRDGKVATEPQPSADAAVESDRTDDDAEDAAEASSADNSEEQ